MLLNSLIFDFLLYIFINLQQNCLNKLRHFFKIQRNKLMTFQKTHQLNNFLRIGCHSKNNPQLIILIINHILGRMRSLLIYFKIIKIYKQNKKLWLKYVSSSTRYWIKIKTLILHYFLFFLFYNQVMWLSAWQLF